MTAKFTLGALLAFSLVVGCGASGSADSDAGSEDGSAPPTGRSCVNVSTLDQACRTTDDCDAATYCLSGSCVAKPADGEPCGDGVYCAAGLACDFDFATGGSMLCAPLPVAGEACALGETGPSLCASGFGCRMGVCGDLPGDGEICTVDNRCAGDLGCDFRRDGSFCAPRRSDGAACETDTICQPGSYCDFGELRCKPVEPRGARCTDGNECGSDGSCVPDAAGRFRCVPLPGAGDVCFFDCQPGLTCLTI